MNDIYKVEPEIGKLMPAPSALSLDSGVLGARTGVLLPFPHSLLTAVWEARETLNPQRQGICVKSPHFHTQQCTKNAFNNITGIKKALLSFKNIRTSKNIYIRTSYIFKEPNVMNP